MEESLIATSVDNLVEQPNLDTLYDRFIAYLDVSQRTAETYASSIRQLLRWLADNGITEPKRNDIIRYRDELRKTLKPTTVQNYIIALRRFFSWTAQEELYPNIASNIKGAKLDNAHKRDYLTSSQVQSVLDAIDTTSVRGLRDYAIISLMVTGGLRDIEVTRADRADLKLLGDSEVLYLQGKGRDERTEYIKVVPEVDRAIRSYLAIRTDNSESLFVSLSNRNIGERLTTRSISRMVKGRLRDAGFDSSTLTAHSLRHTAVTLALIGGVGLDEARQFARHRSINTTLIYAHNLERTQNRSELTIAASIFGGE